AEAVLVDWIERATGPVVVMAASRMRPRSPFVDSALFPDRLFPIELAGLPEDDSVELLVARGCAPGRARLVHRECRGQPFAMLLAEASPGLEETLGSTDGITGALVQRLVGQVVDPASRDALTLMALAG